MAFNRYTRLKELMFQSLQTKTGWGRNELMQEFDRILILIADEEIQYLRSDVTPITKENSHGLPL